MEVYWEDDKKETESPIRLFVEMVGSPEPEVEGKREIEEFEPELVTNFASRPYFSFRDGSDRLFAFGGIGPDGELVFCGKHASTGQPIELIAKPHQLLSIFVSGAKICPDDVLRCIRWFYIIQPATMMLWFATMLPQLLLRMPQKMWHCIMLNLPFTWCRHFTFQDEHRACFMYFIRQNPRLFTRFQRLLWGRTLYRQSTDNPAVEQPNEVVFIDTFFHTIVLIADLELNMIPMPL